MVYIFTIPDNPKKLNNLTTHYPGQTCEVKAVRGPGIPKSYEFLFQKTGLSGFYLNLGAHDQLVQELTWPRLERAIGVITLNQIAAPVF